MECIHVCVTGSICCTVENWPNTVNQLYWKKIKIKKKEKIRKKNFVYQSHYIITLNVNTPSLTYQLFH